MRQGSRRIKASKAADHALGAGLSAPAISNDQKITIEG
jgi:hypothetical protein